jgi:hypothetical protein
VILEVHPVIALEVTAVKLNVALNAADPASAIWKFVYSADS